MVKGLLRAQRGLAVGIVALSLITGNLAASVTALAAQSMLTGTFTTYFLDPQPGSTAQAETRYVLTDDAGAVTDLQIAPSVLRTSGGRSLLDRQRVTVSGAPGITAQGNAAPTLAVQSITLASGATAQSAPKRTLTGGQPFLNVLCKFSDIAVEPKDSTYFDFLMGAGTNSLGEFFSQASYGNINLNGTSTVGWFPLPQPKSFYLTGNANPTDAQLDKLAQDCAALIPNTVDMNPIKGLNFMFNGDLGSVAIGGTGTSLTINGVSRFWSSTWMPPWGYSPQPNTVGGQTVLAHEMGHAFGLDHSAGPTGVTYQNAWDVLSDTYTFCGNPGATDPTFGCLGQHMIAYDKDKLGWIPGNQKFTYAGTGQTLTFGALADASSPNYYYAVIPHTGTTTQFTTVEFRRQIGYDRKLPGNAVIIHEVDTTRTDPAWVQGTDGGAGAMFTAGKTYTASNTGGLKITVQSIDATTASVTIGNVVVSPPTVPPPPARPGASTGGVPDALPGTRGTGTVTGIPNPIPPSR